MDRNCLLSSFLQYMAGIIRVLTKTIFNIYLYLKAVIIVIEWISANKEWVFSGIGVALVSWIFFRNSSGGFSQKQSSGKNSRNIQIGKIKK